MDANAARELFRKYQKVIEDLWIEKQCCRNLIIDKGLMSEAEIDSALQKALQNPEHRRTAADVFSGSNKTLAQFGAEDSFDSLSKRPPPKDKHN
jgi:hypothetical protein